MRNDDTGKDSKEKEEAETEEDELTKTETALKAAIRNMKAQKIKNLMKMVTGKDPADALAILSGSDVAFALQKREQAEIDDTFPQPNALQWVAFIQRCLKAEMLLPEAFSNLNTADLFQALTEMRQRTVGGWASLTKPALPGDDPAVKQGFHEVVDLIEQVGLAHYEIVRAGCFLHVLLSQLFDKYGALPFLASKGQLEHVLFQYNSHNPHLAIAIEEQELPGVLVMLAITSRAHQYLMSAEFYAYREKKAVASKPAAPGKEAKFGSFSANVNMISKMPSKTPAEDDVVAKRLSKGVRGVFQTTTSFVPVTPVTVDLSETRDPLSVLNDIAQAVQGLVEKGLDFISQMKKIARAINFNIYSLEFGEATPLQDNRTMMQSVRKGIYTYILKGVKTSNTLEPAILLKYGLVTQAFAGSYGAGPVVQTEPFGPGEEREITLETSAIMKRITEESDSFVDALTTTVKDSTSHKLQNQLQRTNTDTTEVNQYQDTTQSTQEDKGVSASAKLNIAKVVKAEANADWSKSVATGKNAGSSTLTNTCLETAVTNAEEATQEQINEAVANRTRTTAKTARQEEELSERSKESRKLKNNNRASPITDVFCQMIQFYNKVTSTSGFVVQFGNGSIIVEAEVAAVQADILDRFVKPEFHAMIWDFIKASAKIVDYQGRLVDLLDEGSNPPRLLGQTLYFDLLRRRDEPVTAEDLTLTRYSEHLSGVVLRVSKCSLPVSGLLCRTIVGAPALDSYESRLAEIEVDRAGKQRDLMKSELEDRALLRESVKAIPDPVERARMAFLNLQRPGEVFQKASLNAFSGLDKIDPKDGGKMKKMQEILRDMKTDV